MKFKNIFKAKPCPVPTLTGKSAWYDPLFLKEDRKKKRLCESAATLLKGHVSARRKQERQGARKRERERKVYSIRKGSKRSRGKRC